MDSSARPAAPPWSTASPPRPPTASIATTPTPSDAMQRRPTAIRCARDRGRLDSFVSLCSRRASGPPRSHRSRFATSSRRLPLVPARPSLIPLGLARALGVPPCRAADLHRLLDLHRLGDPLEELVLRHLDLPRGFPRHSTQRRQSGTVRSDRGRCRVSGARASRGLLFATAVPLSTPCASLRGRRRSRRFDWLGRRVLGQGGRAGIAVDLILRGGRALQKRRWRSPPSPVRAAGRQLSTRTPRRRPGS